jgi:hypothetical protein
LVRVCRSLAEQGFPACLENENSLELSGDRPTPLSNLRRLLRQFIGPGGRRSAPCADSQAGVHVVGCIARRSCEALGQADGRPARRPCVRWPIGVGVSKRPLVSVSGRFPRLCRASEDGLQSGQTRCDARQLDLRPCASSRLGNRGPHDSTLSRHGRGRRRLRRVSDHSKKSACSASTLGEGSKNLARRSSCP